MPRALDYLAGLISSSSSQGMSLIFVSKKGMEKLNQFVNPSIIFTKISPVAKQSCKLLCALKKILL